MSVESEPVGVNKAGAVDADALNAAKGQSQDDDSDWEYEYSTTETETYYLTVDLTIPEFASGKVQHQNPQTRNRGHYYKSKAGQHRKIVEKRRRGLMGMGLSDDEGDKTDGGNPTSEKDDADPDPEDDNDDDAEMELNDQRRHIDKGKGVDRGDGLEEGKPDEAAAGTAAPPQTYGDIQILDLHSKTPFISYRGHVFEGSWAANIGTELLFAKHERDGSLNLPALKTLKSDGGDVDVLAASWSRLLTTEVSLVPRQAAGAEATEAAPRQKTDRLTEELRAIRQRDKIEFPITLDKTGERSEQARFLENLQALKRLKGEGDEVTFHAFSARHKGHMHPRGRGGAARRQQQQHRRRRTGRYDGLLVPSAPPYGMGFAPPMERGTRRGPGRPRGSRGSRGFRAFGGFTRADSLAARGATRAESFAARGAADRRVSFAERPPEIIPIVSAREVGESSGEGGSRADSAQ